MNYKQTNDTEDPFLEYQAIKLQGLIAEMVKCCQDRKFFENQKFGLPSAEVQTLLLFKGERYLTVKTIAEKLDVAKSRVTKLVSGLLNKKLVDRIEDPQDSRVKLISLTPNGKAKLQQIESFQLFLHKQLLLYFEPEERTVIIAQVEKLRTGMEAIKRDFK